MVFFRSFLLEKRLVTMQKIKLLKMRVLCR